MLSAIPLGAKEVHDEISEAEFLFTNIVYEISMFISHFLPVSLMENAQYALQRTGEGAVRRHLQWTGGANQNHFSFPSTCHQLQAKGMKLQDRF